MPIAHQRAVGAHLAEGSTPLCLWSAFISSQTHNGSVVHVCAGKHWPHKYFTSKKPRCQEALDEALANNSYHLLSNTSRTQELGWCGICREGTGGTGIEGYIVPCVLVLHAVLQSCSYMWFCRYKPWAGGDLPKPRSRVEEV